MHFTLTDLIADITQNGAESGADLVELDINETVDLLKPGSSEKKSELRFSVKDNGKGMTPPELERAKDPFVTDGVKHPHRKVGLGLPFLIQTAEQSGGGWKIESVKEPDAGHGTVVSAWFDLGNVDTPPIGDIPGLLRTALLLNGPVEMVIRRVRDAPDGKHIEYEVRKTELAEALGDLEDVQSLILLGKYLESLESSDET